MERRAPLLLASTWLGGHEACRARLASPPPPLGDCAVSPKELAQIRKEEKEKKRRRLENVNCLKGMGYSAHAARQALHQAAGNLEEALKVTPRRPFPPAPLPRACLPGSQGPSSLLADPVVEPDAQDLCTGRRSWRRGSSLHHGLRSSLEEKVIEVVLN